MVISEGTAIIGATIAVGTIVANAAIAWASVSRIERSVERNTDDINELRTEVAVLKAHHSRGGE